MPGNAVYGHKTTKAVGAGNLGERRERRPRSRSASRGRDGGSSTTSIRRNGGSSTTSIKDGMLSNGQRGRASTVNVTVQAPYSGKSRESRDKPDHTKDNKPGHNNHDKDKDKHKDHNKDKHKDHNEDKHKDHNKDKHKDHNKDTRSGGEVHTDATYFRSSSDNVNHLVLKITSMSTPISSEFKDLTTSSMVRQAQQMHKWHYEHDPILGKSVSVKEMPEIGLDEPVIVADNGAELDLDILGLAKIAREKAMKTAKGKMTDAGRSTFDGISKKMDETAVVLGTHNYTTAPKFVTMKIRSDIFKGLMEKARDEMNVYTAGVGLKKEVLIKPPSCISSVKQFMPVVVPSHLLEDSKLTWVSALEDINLKDGHMKDVSPEHQKEYLDLLNKMLVKYNNMKEEFHKPHKILGSVPNPEAAEHASSTYQGSQRLNDVEFGAGGDGDLDGTEDGIKRSYGRRWAKGQRARVIYLKKMLTKELEDVYHKGDGTTPNDVTHLGFKKGTTVNAFVSIVINQVATIGVCTWGKSSCVCNLLEINQKVELKNWLDTYAEGFVKLADGQYAVGHKNHLTEDEHTVQVATALWLIDNAGPDVNGVVFRAKVGKEHHFNARAYMKHAQSLDYLVQEVRNDPLAEVKTAAVVRHRSCMEMSVTNKLLHLLTDHVSYTTGVFTVNISSILQDTIVAKNFSLIQNHLFANQEVVHSSKETTMPTDLAKLNLFKVYHVKVDDLFFLEQGTSGVGILRHIQEMCSYYQMRSLLHRLGVGIVSKADSGNILEAKKAAQKRSMVSHTRFDKSYVIKHVESVRYGFDGLDDRLEDDDVRSFAEVAADRLQEVKKSRELRRTRSATFSSPVVPILTSTKTTNLAANLSSLPETRVVFAGDVDQDDVLF
ncbi:hypothetical protein T484DRAFT_1757051 [Baffinella frigidus]|nr:hypothetical protein T484DRAFT_1757051 [Cryptophyta sp. CCMP2293]